MEPNPSADIGLAGITARPVVDVNGQPFVRFAARLTDGTDVPGHLPSDEARLVAFGIAEAAVLAESDAHLYALVAELDTPELAATILAELRDRRRIPQAPPEPGR